MTHHVVIDLETLGTTPGCPILSLGAVIVREDGTEVDSLSIAFDLNGQFKAGLVPEHDTLRWWATETSEAARRSAFPPAHKLYDLDIGLSVFWDFSRRGSSDACAGVWGWPASFDLAILETAWRRVGKSSALFDHRLSRCGKTLAAITGIRPDRDSSTHHDALADARAQASAITRGLARIAALTAALDVECAAAVTASLAHTEGSLAA